MSQRNIDFLTELEDVILQRLADAGEQSYTARLAAAGGQRIAQKVGEEAVELALASVGGDRGEIVAEAADLVYHLLVLLADRDVTLAEVVATLEARHQPQAG